MVLLALESGGARTRLGLSVSRKTGDAHLRNRIKRRLREIFRRSPGLQTGARDLCLIIKPGAGLASSAELSEEFSRLLQKARPSERRSGS
jgi:ribonuclease P protein component